MNVLMLGRWLPPPRRPVRAMREYHFAHHLARQHQVTLSFIADNPDTAGSISALRNEFGDLEFAEVPRTWKSLASAVGVVTGESCTLSYFRSEALRTRLADRLRRTRFDLVFVSSSSMIRYALDVDPAIPLVVDFGDVDSEWWARQGARGSFPAGRFFRTEAARLRSVEAAAAARAAHCVVGTPDAASLVRSLAPEAAITIIPSGLDSETSFASPPSGGALTVIVNALLGHPTEISEAVAFCRAVVPAVRARVPAARFVVSSGDPLGSLPAINALDGVEVARPAAYGGPALYRPSVAVALVNGGGDLRMSVLEPMTAGVPMVTTPGACQQLGADAGRHLEVCDKPSDFAARIVMLLEDATMRERTGSHGREFVQANFSWAVVATRLDEVLFRIFGRSSPVPAARAPLPRPAALGG